MKKLKILLLSMILIGITESHARVDYGPKPKTAVELIEIIGQKIKDKAAPVTNLNGIDLNDSTAVGLAGARLHPPPYLGRHLDGALKKEIEALASDLFDLITSGEIKDVLNTRAPEYTYGFQSAPSEKDKSVVRAGVSLSFIVLGSGLRDILAMREKLAKKALTMPGNMNTLPHLKAIRDQLDPIPIMAMK